MCRDAWADKGNWNQANNAEKLSRLALLNGLLGVILFLRGTVRAYDFKTSWKVHVTVDA